MNPNSKLKIKHSKLQSADQNFTDFVVVYALKESNQPSDLKGLLPTPSEISERLENLLKDRRD